ncbi:hypothetical protein B0T20DRAFT_7764 [Sordaria brevicollis]|uniref:Calcofluor white hypersensitive protein n=1 Tax=Sordaria brevicollis TaxID=83679 RepID=A0AAE0PMJ8_SORBR|nr:hypothetical protein B0T20DRAFT_7764 [Sordaria brevicollis]
MSQSRVLPMLGAGVVGLGGYYIWKSGGSPSAAEKKFEADLHRGAAKVKSEIPRTHQTDARSEGAAYGKEIGSKIDQAVSQADKTYSSTKSQAEALAKDTKAEALKKIDQFDRTVEQKAAEAKSGVSSWFGSGNSK